MRRLIAFTYKADQCGSIVADACIFTVLERKAEIFNVPQVRPEQNIQEGDVVITFGRTVSMMVDQYQATKKINIHHVVLKDVEALHSKPGNEPHRKEALAELTKLKQFLAEDRYQPTHVTLTSEDLPDLDSKHLLMLQKLTETNQTERCFQTTKNGKLIEIRDKPSGSSKADICITFEEIYTVRQIMDVLGTSEVTLVNNTKSDTV